MFGHDHTEGFEPALEDLADLFGWRRTIRIEVDYRERPSGIPEILENYHIDVRIRTLRFGDYVVSDFATVERKTARDFLISIIDGRLFAQVSKLRTNCRNPILLIEGDINTPGMDVHPRAIQGCLVSICAIWRIPVLFTASVEQTAEVLIMLGEQERRHTSLLGPRKGYRPKRLISRQLFFLQGLPQVGPQLAVRLLKHFGNVERIINASADELLQVEGIGKTTVQRIQEVLRSPWRNEEEIP